MIRNFGRFASIGLLAVAASSMQAVAQQQAPAAPKEVPAAPPQQPSAPAPRQPTTFPVPNAKDFTASSPTREQINQFLTASWGYDENRIWQVQGILKTPVEGVSKVIVFVGDKSGKEKGGGFMFWALPDGKHIIAGEDVYPFGAKPYAENRAKLQQDANGPYRGSASKDLELVEFADFECPHCKEAQANMDKLATDFPKARIVFENFPLERIHPQARLAAEYGDCVTKLGSSTAFFQFADATFEGQEGLATADGATLTLNSAVTKAGLDPAKVAACAATPATAADVDISVKLAQDLNINQTPMLMVNGRQVPVGGIAYDTLKKIVEYQEKLDGIQQ
ncbi:MAG TPA: thioredoxin domain-containing protein [Terracidiphilus sp.]|nr:thioredoxin domain-containing protein [Terracidiphilus sp.]